MIIISVVRMLCFEIMYHYKKMPLLKMWKSFKINIKFSIDLVCISINDSKMLKTVMMIPMKL